MVINPARIGPSYKAYSGNPGIAIIGIRLLSSLWLVLVQSKISFTTARLQNFRSRFLKDVHLDHPIFYSNLV